MRKTDLAWAAGLLEGEGCFTRKCLAGTARNITVQCHMTDLDVLQKLKRVLGVGTINGPYGNGEGNKPRWMFRTSGPEAYVVMTRVLPFMCSRRRKRIRGLMKAFESVKPKTYKLQNLKTGRTVVTKDIVAWAQAHDMSAHGLYMTLVGRRTSCYGWRRIK